MSILAYITDLFFQAQMSQAAQAAAVEVKVVSSLYHFLPGLEAPPSMVMIDLDAKGISPTTLIAQVKEKKPDLPVIAYGAPEQQELFEQARNAGADRVLPREQVSDELESILKQYGTAKDSS
ncbi:MAG: hypothetical protein V3R94_00175 [Acidobacteriota bacterium]